MNNTQQFIGFVASRLFLSLYCLCDRMGDREITNVMTRSVVAVWKSVGKPQLGTGGVIPLIGMDIEEMAHLIKRQADLSYSMKH